jgi:membrane protein DedA with SNARE-associated domain
VGWLVVWVVGRWVHCLIGCLPGWLVDWFVGWLVGRLVSQSDSKSVCQLKHQYLHTGEKFFHQCIKQEMSLNTAVPTSYCS